MGPPPDGDWIGVILWFPFTRLARGHPGMSSISHHFKHGGGFCDLALGDANCGGGIMLRRFWMVHPVARGVFQSGFCALGLTTIIQPPGGTGSYDRPLIQGGPLHQRQ